MLDQGPLGSLGHLPITDETKNRRPKHTHDSQASTRGIARNTYIAHGYLRKRGGDIDILGQLNDGSFQGLVGYSSTDLIDTDSEPVSVQR